MNILDKIIIDKKREVELKKSIIPVSQLEASVLFNSRTYSLSKLLKNSVSGIIAEHKRRSPSKSIINNNFTVEEVVICYESAGACVREAEKQGTDLDGLSDAQFAAIHPSLTPAVRELLTVQGSLDSRSTINGTAPASVRKQLAHAEKNIADLKKWSAKLPHDI